jgi:hypothetical protein
MIKYIVAFKRPGAGMSDLVIIGKACAVQQPRNRTPRTRMVRQRGTEEQQGQVVEANRHYGDAPG